MTPSRPALRLDFALVWLLVLAGILLDLLFLAPTVGVANNGDFERVMAGAGLGYHTTDRAVMYDNWFHPRLAVTSGLQLGLGGYASTHGYLVRLAAAVARPFDPAWFDLRVLAGFYSAALLGALGLFLLAARPLGGVARFVLAGLAVFVFADAGYVAYYNSLYGEALTHAALLVAVAAALAIVWREKPAPSLLALYFLAAAMVVGAKLQNAPLGLVMGAVGLRLTFLHASQAWRQAAIVGVAAMALGVALVGRGVDPSITVINAYQRVFYGVLADSPTPADDLKALGLDPRWAKLAGTNYWSAGRGIDIHAPAFEAALRAHAGPGAVAAFWLRHPDRWGRLAQRVVDAGFTIKPTYLGNYAKESGAPAGKVVDEHDAWSEAKRAYQPRSPWVVGAAFLVYGLGWAWAWWRAGSARGRAAAELALGAAAIALGTVAVSVLGDGFADLAKHLFTFDLGCDLMLMAVVGWGLARASARRAAPPR